MFFIYAIFSIAFSPFICLYLIFGLIIGRENKAHICERCGVTPIKKQNNEDFFWVLCDDLEQITASLELIKKILSKYKNLKIIVTTSTKLSIKFAQTELPKISNRIFYQYTPIDTYLIVGKFLRRIKPKMIIFVESKIRPNLIVHAGKKNIPIVLANAKLSDKELQTWKKFPHFKNTVFSYITMCFPKSKNEQAFFQRLGLKNSEFVENIRYDGEAPTLDKLKMLEIKDKISSRPVLFASNTCIGEEKIIINVYKKLQKENKLFKNLVLIIRPKQQNRTSEIVKICKQENLQFGLKSKLEMINNKTTIFIDDTTEDLGILYSLSDVIFSGGSIVDAGGNSPLEPAKLKKGVITGPYVKNFSEIYEEMFNSNSAIKVINELELYEEIKALLDNEDKREELHENAYLFVKSKEGASEKILNRILLLKK